LVTHPLNATLKPGDAWVAFSYSSAVTRSAATGSSGSTMANSSYSGGGYGQLAVGGIMGLASDSNNRLWPFQGFYSAQSAAFPGTIATGDVSTGASVNLWFRLDGAITG